jgi:hypothetical protein
VANVTPHATPAGGFPLVLTTFKSSGAKTTITFPTASAINPADAEAEALYKSMRVLTAGGTFGSAAS